MEYTKNYHLPQWVKSDRIMMEDFNQMCMSIENGLTETSASASAASSAAEDTARKRLRRLGYDLCQHFVRGIAAGAPRGHIKGLAFNGLTTEEERQKVSGLYLLPGEDPQLGPQTGMTLEKLNACVTKYEEGIGEKVAIVHPVAVVEFTASCRGVIRQLDFWFRMNFLLHYRVKMTVTAYDKTAKKYLFNSGEMEMDDFEELKVQHTIQTEIPLETGHQYRLEAAMTETAMFDGRTGFGADGGDVFLGGVDPILYTTGSIQDALTLDTPANLAVATVHCTGGDRTPVLKVNGTAMRPAAARQSVSAKGNPCTEHEFYLEGDWSGTVPLRAEFESEAEDLTVHDLEFYLI